MSRLALYRKWRPLTFRDVVEQRHVVDTLRNAMKADAVGHAYLFCGTRGTGKTTMAKIFARAINCLDPWDGDPCNVCDVCKGILEGTLLDVMEMDAASNNSVDNIRDIRDEVIYAPAVARYKVYIIDEVHMLSQGAFNALLKTLEEPPDRVVFILATTEPQKLPATVLSRCQRFDFKRITEQGIADRLGEIATDCGITVAPAALLFLARLAGGALRDAISLLDQLTTLGRTEIDMADVNEMAGFASNASIRRLAGALLAGDIAASWSVLDTLMREGRDLSQLCVQLLSWFRNVLLLQMGGEASPLLDVHPDDMEEARQAARALTGQELSAWLRELSEHELRLRRTDNPRIMMEVLLLRLCTRTSSGSVPQSVGSPAQPTVPAQTRETSSDGLLQRIAGLERQMAALAEHLPAHVAQGGGVVSPHGPGSKPVQVRHEGDPGSARGRESLGESTSRSGAYAPAAQASAGLSPGGVTSFSLWPRVIDEVKRLGPSRAGGMKLFAYLLDTECLQLADQQLRVVVSADDFLKRRVLSQSDSLELLSEAVAQVTGQAWQLCVVDAKEADALRQAANRKQSADPSGQAGSAGNPLPRAEPDAAAAAGSVPEKAPETHMPEPPVSTGDDVLDRLLSLSKETGVPLDIADEPDAEGGGNGETAYT